VEDQQSAAGDLTDDTTSEPPRTPVGKARRRVRSGAGDAADAADAAAEPAPAGEPVATTARRVAPRWAPAAIGVAAVAFIGAGAFTAATLQPYLAQRALVDTKLDIARTAADAITTLWTYTPENMESLADRSARFLGGDFEAQYRKYVDAIAPTNKQAQVTNNTQVVGAAVESVSGRDATAIVYTNSTATSPLSKDIPSLRYLSYRLTLQREDAQWLVTSMDTITSLDLTPQL
jgi:Mce-associated membrane protein